MSWIAAGVAVVGGGIKLYKGYKQKQAGKNAEGALDKPEFEIPQEALKNMSIAERAETQGLPDSQKQAFLENQQRSSQTALRNSSDRRGGLGVVSQIQGQENLSNRQLLQDDVNARQQNMQRAMDARNVIAGYKDKRFEHEYSEYSTDLDYARAQQGAGQQNMSAGMDTMISGAGQGLAGYAAARNAPGIQTTGKSSAFETSEGGAMIGGTGFEGGAMNANNYSGGDFTAPTSAFGGQTQGGGFGSPSFINKDSSLFANYDWLKFPKNGKTE
tara:strand:- start:1911 stop:2726 length:816 start_codon:yes stop_codon:yes gene_type:complete